MRLRRPEIGRRFTYGAAVVIVAIVALVAPLPSGLIEAWYSRGVYIRLQRVVTPVSNLLPIALLDVAALAALWLWGRQVVRAFRSPRRLRAGGWLFLRFVVFASAVYLLFLAVWGLNYRRVPLEDKLPFDSARITRENAVRVGQQAVTIVNGDYAAAHAAAPDVRSLREAFARAQRLLDDPLPAVTGVPKRSLLGVYFRWAAIDGMTDPFFLEIILNPDVLPVERPFVLAHEWAHLAGYADEAEANFVAWLTCTQGDALARYSGWLALYGHLARAVPPPDRRALGQALAPGPRADIVSINARLLRSAPIVRRAASDAYDSYLKANRVERGIASYDAVVRLVLGTAAANRAAHAARRLNGTW
jgi:hypothetical protein